MIGVFDGREAVKLVLWFLPTIHTLNFLHFLRTSPYVLDLCLFETHCRLDLGALEGQHLVLRDSGQGDSFLTVHMLAVPLLREIHLYNALF